MSYEEAELTPENTTSATPKKKFSNVDVYEAAYPSTRPFPLSTPSTIRTLYGKVDTDGYAVQPKLERISQIRSEEDETHYALDIVKDCFEELLAYYERLSVRGKVDTSSPTLASLTPQNSWSNSRIDYAEHISEVIEEFNKAHYDSPVITDYSTYEVELAFYMSRLPSLSIPVTFSEYSLSNTSTPLHTGLSIDIAIEDAGNDEVKYEAFIEDPNFELYRNAVKRFGFRVDKNVPWRLHFEVNSPYAIEKMRRQGVKSLREFFLKYYDRTCHDELGILSKTIPEKYSKFFDETYSYSVPVPCRTRPGEMASRSLSRIPPASPESHESFSFLRLYIFLRATELGKLWTQREFNRFVETTEKIAKHRGALRAITHAESSFTDRTSSVFPSPTEVNKRKFERTSMSTPQLRSFSYRASSKKL